VHRGVATSLRIGCDRFVGHSPGNEAAVLGLAGEVIPSLGKSEGVLPIEDGGIYRVEPLS